jgi:hypothetical protein
MPYKRLHVQAKANEHFKFSNKQNRPVFQNIETRKVFKIKDIELALRITENWDVNDTIQYFQGMGVDYLRVCKYHKMVSQLEYNYNINEHVTICIQKENEE